jgi:RNA polymerase sigma-70 factor (ECF subfamily)
MAMSFEGVSDNQVMVAFCNCDPQAFDEIVNRWTDRIWRYLRRWARDPDDLTQDTFMRVLMTKDAPNYDPARPFAPWLYRVAHNVAESARRGEERRPQPGPLVEDLLEKAPAASTVQLDADLEECVNTLTDREREFLSLWEGAFGHLSQTEIAEVWEAANSTVTKIKQSALEKLRVCMEQKGYRR